MLSKHKTDNTIQFIDASGEDFYKKETNNNILNNEHIEKIMTMFDNKEEVAHVATSVPYDEIVKNEYNLSVSSYVEAKDNREVIDITALNAQIKDTVTKIDKLRTEIDDIIEVLES